LPLWRNIFRGSGIKPSVATRVATEKPKNYGMFTGGVNLHRFPAFPARRSIGSGYFPRFFSIFDLSDSEQEFPRGHTVICAFLDEPDFLQAFIPSSILAKFSR